MNQPRESGSAGFTIVELVVVAALLGLLVSALATLASSGGDAQQYSNRLNRATELTQDLIDQVRGEMVSAVRLFGDDAEGGANLALLELDGQPTPIAGTRLPTIAPNASLRADTSGDEITGNALFFARLAWIDRFECSSGREYLVDVYRWNHYYLTTEEQGPQPGSAIGLNLVRFESEPMASAESIDRIANAADRADVLEHLHDGSPDATGASRAPCVVVWRRGAMPNDANALRGISGSGNLSTSPTDGRGGWSILPADGMLRGLLSYRQHSVATNYAPANYGVGRYSLRDASGGFPHGLEVQIVGPSNGRQTLFHLVVASTNQRGQRAWSNVQAVIDTREL